MNGFLDANHGKDESFTERKKIVIKHIKIKRATRTCLYNINEWIDEDLIKDLKKSIQKKLATSSQIVEDDDGYALTFNGDHTQCIRDLMIKHSNGKLTSEAFD